MFTHVKSTVRRITPDELNGRSLMKVVYVVLESQYQSTLSAAARAIDRNNPNVTVELSGYLIEELRDPENYENFKRDVAEANIFIASLVFIEDLADKVVAAVEPHRDNLDVAVVFPSLPKVMRLNKMGRFSMENLGQSKSAIAQFMRKRKEKKGSSFEDSMLKLLRTLPKVLKYMPTDKAQDARHFMLSFQYWLGGSSENLENFLLMLADKYVFKDVETFHETSSQNSEGLTYDAPVVYPDMGIWHPLAPKMFESQREYWEWFNQRDDLSESIRDPLAPCVGLVLQRTHLVTGDDAHYVAMVQELEAMGARVIAVFSGGLDFSKPVDEYFWTTQTPPSPPLVRGGTKGGVRVAAV
ncbi:MAG: DUF3479 domain-containing protein, partial [Cyanobacteriota bacterium]|nr:DUF3479 domain-containing protein [Cyanobacteriota bacterium]